MNTETDAPERWYVDTNAARLVIKDENKLAVAFITGDPTEPTVRETAYMMAAAPALRDALARLFDWVQGNQHNEHITRALVEDCGQALQDARAPE
jgi:hypothetical protein